ncbi:MAG: 4-oxalomesaconate tautomerase, partial [Alphaproteobacteria bacterium]|nr:4-oxalomesaconate tautomerase [Alphaproteobacteria bacterium]
MTQTAIPFLFMRGGSSRGPYFKRSDLPEDRDKLSEVLIAAVGSGHPLNIDGIGGGNAVTTKVAMLSASEDDWADIDYFFAQVSVEDRLVDYKPTCGNILTGVGPAALEMGLIEAKNDITEIRIRAVNTGARIRSLVVTPQGHVTYEGDAAIDGVPGTAAPVELNFMDVAGSSTGKFLPTGNLVDTVNGVEITCMDVAMPMVMARASDFGLTGEETSEELDANRTFFDKMEEIRIKAGLLMGMGDCTRSVTPKFGLFAPHPETGHIITRYFMPWNTHPTMAVTGSQCMASCALTPGTVAA